jgi:hypothetical protein
MKKVILKIPNYCISSPDMSHCNHLATKWHAGAADNVHKCFLHSTSSSGHRQSDTWCTAHTFSQRQNHIKNTYVKLYDYALDMSGKYSGQHVNLKNLKQSVDYILYAAHSLNPVGSETLPLHNEPSWFPSCWMQFLHYLATVQYLCQHLVNTHTNLQLLCTIHISNHSALQNIQRVCFIADVSTSAMIRKSWQMQAFCHKAAMLWSAIKETLWTLVGLYLCSESTWDN